MKKMLLNSMAAFILLNAWQQNGFAQNTITFDDVVIPDSFPSLSKSTPVSGTDVAYSFTSNGVVFNGTQHSWGNFSGFDCSRGTDTTDGSYANDISAKPGKGQSGTNQYLVAYISADWPDYPNQTVVQGLKLADTARLIEKASFANTTLTYKYIQDNWSAVSIYAMVIKGYNAGVVAEDSIYFAFAEKTATDSFLLADWQEVDMSALGEVDSITFQLFTDDANGYLPFYFAMDEIQLKAPESTSIENSNWATLQAALYPNPATQALNIKTQNQSNLAYVIYNIQGQIVAQGYCQQEINISSLQAGNYFVQLSSLQQKQSIVLPFVKK